MRLTLDHLRRYAIARSLFTPTTLGKAIGKLGFVQADPIRAPARAQDLTLRHRVVDYAAGDLERRYPKLPIEEDFFVNYGFLPRAHHGLMHPRVPRTAWSAARKRKAQDVLEFILEQGPVHPRIVDAHFAHGKITNWFGGSSNATTHLLDDMHYRGMLRIARRDSGTRIYAGREPVAARAGRSGDLEWYWPGAESPRSARWRLDDEVRLLTPFDPVVWDRRRFTIFWDWVYRFEAYTPAPKRKLGYYALPMLWRDRVVGWGNLSVIEGALRSTFGYIDPNAPRDTAFQAGLEAELARMNRFLGLG